MQQNLLRILDPPCGMTLFAAPPKAKFHWIKIADYDSRHMGYLKSEIRNLHSEILQGFFLDLRPVFR